MDSVFYYWLWFPLVLGCVLDAWLIIVSVYQFVIIYRGNVKMAGSTLFVLGQFLRAVVGIFAEVFLINALYHESLPFWVIFAATIVLFLAQMFSRRWGP